MQASPAGTSVIPVHKGFKQNQNVAVSLSHHVAHYLVGTAETMRYFTIISNFLRIAQLQQEVTHLGPADGTFKVKATSLWLIQAKNDFVFTNWAQEIYPLNIKVTTMLPWAILNKRDFSHLQQPSVINTFQVGPPESRSHPGQNVDWFGLVQVLCTQSQWLSVLRAKARRQYFPALFLWFYYLSTPPSLVLSERGGTLWYRRLI